MNRFRRVWLVAPVVFALVAGCAQKDREEPKAKAGAEAKPAAKQTGGVAKLGEPMKQPKAKALTVKQVLNNPEKYKGKVIHVRGTVTRLCAQSGCWMEIADKPKGKPLFVEFTFDRDAGGRIPENAVGHEAVVEGEIVVATMTEAERKHHAEVAGDGKQKVDEIKGDVQVVRVKCPAATIKGVKLAEPRKCTNH